MGLADIAPLPTPKHQLIVLYLYRLLHASVTERSLGTTLVAALPVLLWSGQYREPDVIFMLEEHRDRWHNTYWEGADLVMEVVSPGAENRERDLVIKRREYAWAGIPEYWIVDPEWNSFLIRVHPPGTPWVP